MTKLVKALVMESISYGIENGFSLSITDVKDIILNIPSYVNRLIAAGDLVINNNNCDDFVVDGFYFKTKHELFLEAEEKRTALLKSGLLDKIALIANR